MPSIIIDIAIFLISAIVFFFVGFIVRKKIAESKLSGAESEAKRIIEAATKLEENELRQLLENESGNVAIDEYGNIIPEGIYSYKLIGEDTCELVRTQIWRKSRSFYISCK